MKANQIRSRKLRIVAILVASAALLPFAATQAVHIAFQRPLLDGADTAMVSVLFAIAVLLIATLGLATAARELDPPPEQG